MTHRLLVCADGSTAAIEAARVAVDLVARHGGEILGVFVADVRAAAETTSALGGDEAWARDRLLRGGRAVLATIEQLGESRGVAVETALEHGEPVDAIMHAAQDWDPDLILIGRTGRRGPGSSVMGSTTAHIIEFTEWPVVVVPARRDRQEAQRSRLGPP